MRTLQRWLGSCGAIEQQRLGPHVLGSLACYTVRLPNPPNHPTLTSNPCHRGAPAPPPRIPDEVLASDPDNMPPHSRLFVVVPKAAEIQVIQVGC